MDELARRFLEFGNNNYRLGVAESLTGGLLADALVNIPGASTVFAGGVVTYQTSQKTNLLGVSPELIANNTVVSAVVAEAMAQGVIARLQVGYALATTGVAGPEPLAGHPVGEVWLGLAYLQDGETVTASQQVFLTGNRLEIRKQAVVAALNFGCERLLQRRKCCL